MPWQTPTLEQLRSLNRDNITALLRSGPMIPNSVLRVMADSNAGLGYLVLLYINWLSLQLLPDTAETQWLDRHGNIWVGGRKTATFATGVATATGINDTVLPLGAQLTASTPAGLIAFATTQAITIGSGATPVNIAALSAGQTGLVVGSSLSFTTAIAGIDGQATITAIADGVNAETDDELRARVLDRIREPPMGGDAFDYVEWALGAPGVTRAWCSPGEQGIGTVTVRFMMDDLRAGPLTVDGGGAGHGGGFPESSDVASVMTYLEGKRPVSLKDFFVVAPIPQLINFTVNELDDNNAATQAAIGASVAKMLAEKAAPATSINGVGIPAATIYAAWVSEAVLQAAGVVSFDLVMVDQAPASNGALAMLGTPTYPP
jgi:uncharacterized phage protein gp47/JayE